MSLHHLLLGCAPLIAMLVCAAVTDLHNRRIPNWLSFSLVLAGIGQSLTAYRTISPGAAFLGLAAGFCITFILFALGALGGGDVKLLAGVGAWLGPRPVIAVFAIAALIGMCIVLAQALWQGRMRVLVRNTAVVAINLTHLNDVGVDHAVATGRACRSVDRPLPYAVPVFLAVLAVLALSAR